MLSVRTEGLPKWVSDVFPLLRLTFSERGGVAPGGMQEEKGFDVVFVCRVNALY